MAMNATRRFFSNEATKTLSRRIFPSSMAIKEKEPSNSLYRRVSALGGTDGNVAETVNDWVKEGKTVTKFEIIGFVNQLRKYKKYNHAIQLLDWLDDRGLQLSTGNKAVRLDLLSRTKGIDSAEKYFLSLPESSKSKETYGALLNCYCREEMKEKAMELLEKMKELNFVSSYLAYNSLMSLHMKLGEPEKIPPVVLEMKQKNITPDAYTYNFLINSYASSKNIKAVHSVLKEMDTNRITPDWSTMATLASIYIKARHFRRARCILKRSNNIKDLRDRKAYHSFISLYAQNNNKYKVNEVWKSLKKAFPKPTNKCYLTMLLALHKLNDTGALENIFREWKSSSSNSDFRLTNVVIDSCLDRDMIEEAEKHYKRGVQKGGNPNLRTLELFMNFYLKKNQLDLALKYLDSVVSKVGEEEPKGDDKIWKPSKETVCMFLKQLEEEKNVDGAEKLCKILKKVKNIDSEVYNSLLRTYVAAGKTEPRMRQRIKEDGIEMSSETEKLLDTVSQE